MADRKDRNKDGFFNRNFNQLPLAVREQFANAKCAKKRELVNQVIVKNDEGKWQINLGAQILAEWQEKYLDVSKSRGLVTKPAGRASHMWGGWKELEDAVKRKEVWTVTNPGDPTVYYQWKEFDETEREGHRGGLRTSGERKLDLKQYSQINEKLAQYEWNINLAPAELTSLVEQGETGALPEKVIANLEKVQKACSKAVSESKLLWRRLMDLNAGDQTTSALADNLKSAFEAPPMVERLPAGPTA